MKTWVQTESVKPYNQAALVAQILNQQNIAVSITVSYEDLKRPDRDQILKSKIQQARLSLLDFVAAEFDKDVTKLNVSKEMIVPEENT